MCIYISETEDRFVMMRICGFEMRVVRRVSGREALMNTVV